MRTTTTTNQAETRYAEHEKAVRELLYDLLATIELHRDRFDDGGRSDWGFVGDLAHLREQLQETYRFINNQE